MTTNRRTFRTNLARALFPKLLLLACAFAYFAPGYLAPSWDVATDAEVMEIRPQVDDSPAALVAANDCDLPEGTIPGHAVVTVEGRTWLAKGERGFAIWLGADGEAGTGDEAPGIVHGFCS